MTEPFQRYLTLLGIEGRPAGLSGLRVLVRRHLAVVPFENITKLLLYDREGAGRPATLPEYLDGIEFSGLGGTCYTINPFLAELLRELGYDVDLLGADMSRPNVHTCLRVRIGPEAYHVDAGFAAPFRDPIPLAQLPAQVEEGANRWVLARDADSGGLRLNMFSDAENSAGYVAHDPPKPREFFDPVVLDSYAPGAWFMNCLRISRAFAGHSLDLINRKLYCHESGRTAVTPLESIQQLRSAVDEQFAMPRCPIERAIAILERLTGQRFFGA